MIELSCTLCHRRQHLRMLEVLLSYLVFRLLWNIPEHVACISSVEGIEDKNLTSHIAFWASWDQQQEAGEERKRERLSSHRQRWWPGPSAAARDQCSEWGLAYSPCVRGACMSGSPTVGSWTVGGTLELPSLYIVCATNNYKYLYLWVISYW